MRSMRTWVAWGLWLLVSASAITGLNWWVFGDRPEPSASPVPLPSITWSPSIDTADYTIRWSEDYEDLTFSANWPSTRRICLPEGCLTFGDIRRIVSAREPGCYTDRERSDRWPTPVARPAVPTKSLPGSPR